MRSSPSSPISSPSISDFGSSHPLDSGEIVSVYARREVIPKTITGTAGWTAPKAMPYRACAEKMSYLLWKTKAL